MRLLADDADGFRTPVGTPKNFGVCGRGRPMGAGIPVIVSDQVGIHREISAAGKQVSLSSACPEQLETAVNKNDCRSPDPHEDGPKRS